MPDFRVFVFSPAGLGDATLAIAASRAGAVGIYNAELELDTDRAVECLRRLAAQARGEFGVKLDRLDPRLVAEVDAQAGQGLAWVIVDGEAIGEHGESLARMREQGVRLLVEVRSAARPDAAIEDIADGWLVKGNESGGFVGEDASFILLQKWLKQARLPIYMRGGLTPHVAAACAAAGVAGGVLDSQLLLLDEARLPESLQGVIANLAGSETVAVGDGEQGEYFRLLVRPALSAARSFVQECEGMPRGELEPRVAGRALWREPAGALLPIGQDVAFAAPWRRQHRRLAEVLAAFRGALDGHLRIAAESNAIAEDSALAKDLGARLPIIQGPMTRVSDTAAFALAVAEGGALPMVALAMLKGQALETLLVQTAELLGERAWGIGLLGFAPQALLDEQLAVAMRFKPSYAIIAGGRPDQAVHLERSGIRTFLHVPAAGLMPTFLQEGARRFIFEGRECGGHIGPLSSFVLWSSMVERLLGELGPGKVRAEEVELILAGGVHDALSSAMAQVLVAPLIAAGARVGILMGSAYLFTREIVASGAIVPEFQRTVLECEHTVNLESGPGHASRCAYTPFARSFFRQRLEFRRNRVPPDESRRQLDDLILGRLLIASKGRKRDALGGKKITLDEAQQREEGMYMLGQVATLRDGVTDIETLHAEVSLGAQHLLRERLPAPEAVRRGDGGAPADVAIVGIACVFPKAGSAREYWENIVARVDAISEIPAHRWDWRLYFDADRNAKDRIYSRWGGFLDDLAFDPLKYGMPPKAIESVDPMQLMGLEVAQRTLADSGYHERPFDRERASVIIGASGGAGDFGMQYGLRAELPRFSGGLPAEIAGRLPEWTEDSFAGILPNVAAGRIANRLNFGGINMATDAACASSLAAVYQGVTELIAGRSDFVIAGGIDTVQGPFGFLCFSKTQALSPRGRCSTFDAGGDGIAISEGIAMVAMKRLADAERDGDRIYAVIKGVGASSDGNAKGLTAPLPAGQLRAMRRAYAMAGYGPATVGLFEAHGTGTVAGDTAELESTTRLIEEEGAAARQAVIGSVKTNIGHTKATAGVAGLVKAALALQRRVLPPHRNVTTPNRVLADPGAPLYLLDEAQAWLAREDIPRRASCSAFGFGGTNFHVTLEEYDGEYRDWLRPAACDAWSAELLLWSAADRASLTTRLEALLGQSLEAVALRDLAASLAAGWRPGEQRLAVVARSIEELRSKLVAALAYLRAEAKKLPPGVYHGEGSAPGGKLALLFSGQGSQYPGMLREAALHFEPVALTLAQADAVLADAFGARFGPSRRLSSFVFPRGTYDEASRAAAREALTSTDVAQPALGAVEVGLLRLMHRLGLRADMAAGHSYGEFVALHAAGALSFDDLMRLSAARGRFIVDAAAAAGSELGTMAAVSASRKVVEEAIADIDGVTIANHNAPSQCVLSGTRAAVAAAQAKLRESGVEASAIPVAAAFHSSLVRPAQQPLAELIEATQWHAPRMPVYSNSLARPHAADVARIKRQMAEHLVSPVEFVAEIEAMYRDGARLFVEIGPKPVLARLASRILEGQAHVSIALDDGSGLAGLLAGMAQLFCAGVALDPAPLFAGRDCRSGDADRTETLLRAEAPPRTAWMLNGSGARRVAEPPRQIGVTLDQANPVVVATAAPAPAASTPAPLQAAAPTVTAASRPSTHHHYSLKRERPMDERRTAPATADASVLSEYFLTMRQFLESQERVMSAYLGTAPAPRLSPAMRSRPTVAALPAEVPAARLPVEVPLAVAAPRVAAAPVPAAEPAPPAPPVVQAAPQPVAAAPAASAAPKPAPSAPAAGAGLGRERLVDMLLAIVEEKTGYPRDMVGLDQNLEADLGIDSIKRIEVVGALLQALPDSHREALAESRGKLNTQATLNGMLDLVSQAKAEGGAVAVPFDSAGAGEKGDVRVAHPPRLAMVAQPEPLRESMARRLCEGCFLITRDRLGVADALAAELRGRAREVVIVEPELLGDEERLVGRCRELGGSKIAGVLHLTALGAAALDEAAGVADWRRAIGVHEKALHVLLRELSQSLASEGHVLAASGLGGKFGRDGSAGSALRIESGAVGMLKSLAEESPELRIKAVDLDPERRTAQQLAADLRGEIELDGGRVEVGYPAGERTIFRTVAAEAGLDAGRSEALRNLVVLATGGARGITAETLRELAAPGNTLVLTGRTPCAEAEAAETAALGDAEALRAHFVAQVRAGSLKLTPAEIQRRVRSLLDQREMQANIADFRSAGAEVEYHALDVTDEAAVRALMDDLRRRHGRIDGIVHGAGVIEDKRLADKSSESWSRVVDTKVVGLLALQRYVDPRQLKFFVVFSSVAGRYGNSGQSDYATANELMNRLCMSLQARWGDRVAVSALCWGPWGATRFGAGMVTPQTEAKFAEKGVRLVSAALGRRLFREALTRAAGGPVEVICGEAPWEEREAEKGAIRSAEPAAELAPLLGACEIETQPTGERRVSLRLDPARHLYLQEHALDEHFVLPAAAALEMMAEAVQALWPGWKVCEVREHKLLKGVELQAARRLTLVVSPPPYGSSEGFEVSVALQSDGPAGRMLTHYRSVVRLEHALPQAIAQRHPVHDERTLSVAKAYGEWLFHGPRLQVIESFDGLSRTGASAQVRATLPTNWLAGTRPAAEGWLFDPALLDAAAQMAWLWARSYRDESALPARFGRVTRYRTHPLPQRLAMHYERVETDDPTLIRAHVTFVDEQGLAVLAIEELDSIASAALNRLGGTARTAEQAPA